MVTFDYLTAYWFTKSLLAIYEALFIYLLIYLWELSFAFYSVCIIEELFTILKFGIEKY